MIPWVTSEWVRLWALNVTYLCRLLAAIRCRLVTLCDVSVRRYLSILALHVPIAPFDNFSPVCRHVRNVDRLLLLLTYIFPPVDLTL